MEQDKKLALALSMAEKGFRIFPVYSTKGVICSCGNRDCKSPGKHPITPNGFKDASTDEVIIRRWFHNYQNCNYGIATGKGLAIIDIDGKEGYEQFKNLFPEFKFNETLIVRTGGGGFHLYFNSDSDETLSCWQNRDHNIDFRGDGGYVVGPGCDHTSLKEYRIFHDGEIKSLSSFPEIKKFVVKKGVLEQSTNGTKSKVTWDDEIPLHYRDNTITSLVGKLARAEIPYPKALNILLIHNKENCKPPLTEKEVIKCLDSIYKTDLIRKEKKDEAVRKIGFPLLSFRDVVDKFQDENNWIIPNWVPAHSICLMVAPPGCYKTWVSLDLAMSVCDAPHKFLGKFKSNVKGPVIYIQSEDDPHFILDRLSIMMNLGKPEFNRETGEYILNSPISEPKLYSQFERLLHFQDRDMVHQLELTIQRLKPELVILDPLYMMVSLDNYMQKAPEQLSCLKDFRDKYGTSFVIIHHSTKGNNNDLERRSRDKAWGMQFINAFQESGFQFSPINDTSMVLNRNFKGAAPFKPIKVEFNITPYEYQVILGKQAEDIEIEVLELLMKGNIKDQKTIMTAIGFTNPTAISRIFKKYGVKKIKDVWSLPSNFEMPDFSKSNGEEEGGNEDEDIS